MRKWATRALAAAALLAFAGALVLILLGRGGGDGSTPGRSEPDRDRAAKDRGAVARPTVASGTEVRNARPQPDWRPYSGPVPIFRWHVVGEAGPGETYSELFVAPTDFRDQMDWLGEHGYEAVGLETVQRAWSAGGTLPAKPVVLSFDGVGGDLLGVVAPELRRRGWPGVLVLDPEAPVDDAAVAELVATGWELEAEGGEPAGSRQALEARFAAPVRDYSFPQGQSADAGDIAALKSAGFDGATATGYGFAESRHPFDQPRITVFGLSRVEGFVEALRSRGAGVGA